MHAMTPAGVMRSVTMRDVFEGKTILVTGGTGSIGSEIVKQLLQYDPEKIRVFSRDDTKQAEMQRRLNDERLRFFIGDVRDMERLKMAIDGVDVIFHTAALKHVNLCEYNPFETVKTNVVGTQNVINAALRSNAEKFINISTDKACGATNTMGAAKLLSEKLTISANLHKGPRRTIFSCVRFGNVIDSRGSVLQIFKEQIRNQHEITITEPEMTRFVMSVSQAVRLVLKAAEIMKGGETFVLKMPSVRLGDFVDALVDAHEDVYGTDSNTVRVKKIGIRPGERMHEYLVTEEEGKNVVDFGDMLAILPFITSQDMARTSFFAQKTEIPPYTSNNVRRLSKEEIKEFLIREKMI